MATAQALADAMASGKVRYAAIDADMFKNPETGEITGPVSPYIDLEKKYRGRMELLPHAAADTEHISRGEGAKQAARGITACCAERHGHTERINFCAESARLTPIYDECERARPAGADKTIGLFVQHAIACSFAVILNEDDEWFIRRPRLGYEQVSHCTMVSRIRAQAINRFSREGDQPTGAQNIGRNSDIV